MSVGTDGGVTLTVLLSMPFGFDLFLLETLKRLYDLCFAFVHETVRIRITL
jgi:hypothetical protein